MTTYNGPNANAPEAISQVAKLAYDNFERLANSTAYSTFSSCPRVLEKRPRLGLPFADNEAARDAANGALGAELVSCGDVEGAFEESESSLTTTSETLPPKTCFISAAAGTNLWTLRRVLESRGLRVLVPQDLAVGTDWPSEIQKQLSQADLVIGVLTTKRESPWVLFELGQASALGRRIVLITSPKSEPLPFSIHHFLVLRIDLENQEAIGFALDQVLSAPEKPNEERPRQSKDMHGLGVKADELLVSLERSMASNNFALVEQVVGDALRASGADVVAPSRARDMGADFAVWSDVLEPFVGNPLLVEVKTRLRGKNEALRAGKQLASYADASGSRSLSVPDIQLP